MASAASFSGSFLGLPVSDEDDEGKGFRRARPASTFFGAAFPALGGGLLLLGLAAVLQ
jgi:hypothetical protein